MSRLVNLGILGLKAFTGLWAFITFAVAAALQSKSFRTSNSVGVIIAAGLLTVLWILVSLVFQFVKRETAIISMLVDTFVYGVLFVLALGGTAAESRNADNYRYYDRFSEANELSQRRLGNATIGLAWILLLAILVFQFIYTPRSHGGSMKIWLTPFHILVADGTARVASNRITGIGHIATTGLQHDGNAMIQAAPQAEVGTMTRKTLPNDHVQTHQQSLGPVTSQQS